MTKPLNSTPEQMWAIVQKNYGPPQTIQIVQTNLPVMSETDVLVRVKYSSVNRTDCGFLQATPFVTRFFSGLIRPKHPILGCEFAGIVEAVGSDVRGLKKGDSVFGFDDVRWGGHGEYKAIDYRKSIVLMPPKSTFRQMAAAGEGSHYALSYIRTIKKLAPKKVLVHGATGAIGSAAVQLMKQEGWYVVATSTTKSIKLVKSLGADRVIDWQKDDFTMHGEQFDVVFDAVGKSRFRDCKKLLVSRGVYIATELGPFVQNPFLALLSPLYRLAGMKRVLFPLPVNKKELFEDIAMRVKAGTFNPVIDREFAARDIKQAYRYVLQGEKISNVVVKIEDGFK